MKEQIFKKILEQRFKGGKNKDLIIKKAIKVRDTMAQKHSQFDNLLISEQAEYCVTIVLIAEQTVSANLKKLRIGNHSDKFPYSIDDDSL